MKKILYPFIVLLAAGLFFPSCEDDFNLAPEVPDLFDTKGAVASFTSPTPDFFDNSAPDDPVTFELATIGEPAQSVRILKSFNGGAQIEHATITSLPATVNVSLNDALTGTGQTVADMKVGDNFTLSFEVTTASGTFRTGSTINIAVSCSTKFPGTYDYEGFDFWCGGDPFSGEVTITETSPGKYTFDDWSFGAYERCYNGFAPANWGTLAFIRYTDTNACDECSQSAPCNMISVEGVDAYGDSWTFAIDEVNGDQLTMTWSNTYGEAGSVTLTRKDGSNWPPLQ